MPRPLAIAAFTALAAALSAADVAASNLAWGVSVNLPGVAVRAGAPVVWGAGMAVGPVPVGPWPAPIVAPYVVVPPPAVLVPVPAWTTPFPVRVAAPVPVVVPRIARGVVVPYGPIRRAYLPAPVRYPPGPRAVHY